MCNFSTPEQCQLKFENCPGGRKVGADMEESRPFYCNFCNASLSKERYKCLTCKDFDLCKSCVDKSEYRDGHLSNHFVLCVSIEGPPGAPLTATTENGGEQDKSLIYGGFPLVDVSSILDGMDNFYLNVDAMAVYFNMPILRVRQIINAICYEEQRISEAAEFDMKLAAMSAPGVEDEDLICQCG